MEHLTSRVFAHFIFQIKNSSCEIRNQDKQELYSYIESVLQDINCEPIVINGMGGHVHILSVVSDDISIDEFVEAVKLHSSRWIKTKSDYYINFGWQSGYASFSVGPTCLDKIRMYIFNQEKEHETITFKEEYLKFLEENDVDYDAEEIWKD